MLLGYGGGVSHPPLVLESGLLTQEDWTRRMSVALFKPCLSRDSATQVDIDMILSAVRCWRQDIDNREGRIDRWTYFRTACLNDRFDRASGRPETGKCSKSSIAI